MKILTITALTFISFLSFKCQKDFSEAQSDVPVGTELQPDLIQTSIQGFILDETGNPAQAVNIKAGEQTTVTDNKGYFKIKAVSLDQNVAVVVAEKLGYFKGFRTFAATKGLNQVLIKLIKKAVVASIDANTGGTATLPNGSSVKLPARAVVIEASGQPYAGQINIFATYIDPTSTDIATNIPGSLLAKNKLDKLVTLSSYGMMAVELQSTSGEKLQIASGKKATLRTLIPISLISSALSSIPLWFVDEADGLWKEQGIASREGNFFVGEVSHFSFWNCDYPDDLILLSASFKFTNGAVASNQPITIKAFNGTAVDSRYGYSDSLGNINAWVPKNRNLQLIVTASQQCINQAIYSSNIGPYPLNTNIGLISIPVVNPLIYRIKGKIVDCANQPVSNGYASIFISNSTIIQNVATNSLGEFYYTFTSCTPPTSNIFPVDVSGQAEGSVIINLLADTVTNVGTLQACGGSAAQYFNYTFDGQSFSMTQDFLGTKTTTSNVTYVNSVSGSKLNPMYKYINLTFETPAIGAPGVYQTGLHLIENTDKNYFEVAPFTSNISIYPHAVGEFYKGSFSGQLKDSLNNFHSISGDFNIRRLQ